MRLNIPNINRITKFFAVFAMLSGLCLHGYGQALNDYRTRQIGNWSNANTWQYYNGTVWVNAVNYPGQNTGSGEVTITSDVTLDISPANAVRSLRLQANLAQNSFTYQNRILTVTNNVSLSSGTLNLSNVDGYRITLNIGGNFSMTGGSITESANTYGILVFNGSGTQIFSKTAGTISNNIRFTVNSGSVFDIGTSVIDGSSGDFTLSSGATLTTAHPEGISLTGATGSIRVGGTRTFSTGASYVYNGNSTQITGSGLPATVNSLTISNAAGVELSNDITIASGGILRLLSGILQAGSHNVIVTNTASAAIVSTAGSFLNVTTGGLQRNLPANLTGAGSNYLFPIGEGGSYKAINLVNVNTGTVGPVLKASVSATGALNYDGITLSSVSPRCWSLQNVNGGNLTSARIELFESGLNATNTIGMSTAMAGDYSAIGGTPGTSSIISPAVTNPGPYFAVGTLIYDRFYSFKTGNWHDYDTWTTDPSGTLQIGNEIPGNGDAVVILTDRTVTLTGNVAETDLNVTIRPGAFLDLATYRFTNPVLSLSGQGTLRLASPNFPSVTSNTFINTGGGTTEYYNSSDFTLPLTQNTYNNLTINTSGAIATQLSNLILNGSLYIESGTFRINDNSSTAKRSLTINGNVSVDNGGSFTVGTGVTNTAIGGTGGTAPFLNYYLNFHTVIIRGDFTNNGTVRFTNLSYPLYNAFPPTTTSAASGAASVYFEGDADNSLTCNGTTDFYNLIINKGIDQTYKLTVTSDDYTHFRLFGANTLAAETVSGRPDLRKALWIYSGTLVLKGRLVIPSLTEGAVANADYYIPSNGSLQVDGVDVVVLSTADDYREINVSYGVTAGSNAAIGIVAGGSNSALYVFGKLQIDNGYVSARESGGIVTSSVASGQVIINGGTIDAKQLLFATGTASYNQTGGLFILRGRFQRTPVAYTTVANLTDISSSTLNTNRLASGTSASYGSFDLENAGNIYSVSGGIIRIYDVINTPSGGAFDVKSSISNISVTGGTLEIMPASGTGTDATNYLINSTAPLYNLLINRSGSTSAILLETPLNVNNDLSLTSGILNANSQNLSVGGNFNIEAGTTYTSGNNITTLNGSSGQTFTISLAAALSLSSFTIDKPAGIAVTLAGTQNVINVSAGFRLVAGTLNDAGKIVNVAGNVYNSGICAGAGRIVLNGTAVQTIDGGGVFGNIELNNSNIAASPVSLIADMTVNGSLTLSRDKIFNISTYNLQLKSSASIVNGGPARFIQTAGNAGDGGITREFSNISAFTFPLGVAGKYTPATIGFTAAPVTYGSITVTPVDYEHPSTTSNGQSLTYFWRVKSSGFSGIAANSVSHTFIYDQADVAGTETSYIPSLYDRAAYTWSNGLSGNINTTTNTISDWSSPSNSKNFLDADYTAGVAISYGTPVIYYSRQTGSWGNTLTWSLTSHTVTNPPASAPSANDIVIIGNGHTVNLTANSSCASLQIEAGSVLDIYTYTGGNFGMVLNHPGGNGLFRVTTPVAPSNRNPRFFTFPSGDFTDFNTNDGTTEFYDIDGTVGSLYILPANVASYGNLILRARGGDNLVLPNRSDLTIYGDLTCTGNATTAWIAMSWNTNISPYYTADYDPTIEKTVHVKGNMYVNAGSFEFFNDEAPQHLVIDSNLVIVPGAVMEIYAAYPFSTPVVTNTLSIGGSLINNGNATFRSASGGRTYVCNVSFTGNNNALITNTGGNPTTTFNNVTVNKGNSRATTLTCNIGGTLNTPADNWLTLQNGAFIYDRTGDLNISTTTDFVIPATAELRINSPSNIFIANSATNGRALYLNGRLTILTGGGNVYVGPSGNTGNNADIEYSGSGASMIEVQSGNLFVNGQIRRPLATTNGILTYRQSGGNVIIYGNNATLTKAKLEVLNDGSEFTMSAGTLTIVRGGGTTFGDLYLRPAASSVTGGGIFFTQAPSAGSAINTVQSYSMDASIPLNNLTVTGTVNNTNLSLIVSPLVLNGSMTISNGQSSFLSNGKNVSLKGNMNNSGTYDYGTNKTTFDGSTQSVTGTSRTDFYDLVVSPVTSLTGNGNFVVFHDLEIASGNLLLNNGLVTLRGNLTNNGAYTDDNVTGGINLQGSVQQAISGTGSYGRLVLDNALGARINNDIILQHDLVLTRGILDINKFQLTLSQNSLISGASFNSTRMIISDGVASSSGILKFFQPGAQTFTFPAGVTGKYTPAIYNITASTTVGSIRINPVDENHPNVLNPLNTLGYYWEIESTGISGFNATLNLQYLPGDVSGTESDYVAARLVLPYNTWDKATPGPATDNVDESLHRIKFTFLNTSNLNGDYTAGIETAIPAVVPTYVTNKNGVWSDAGIWSPVGSSPACPAGGPAGCNVFIDHVVTIDKDFINVLNTTINNELRVVSPTFGHNLGNVDGDGKVYLESGNLPGGTYTAFTDCAGNGTIEYGGTGTYTIVSGLYTSVPNLFFTGTGTRIIPKADLTVCKRLVIDGPILDNRTNKSKLTILGTMERYGSGAFKSGTGSYPSSTVCFAGTTIQSIGGATGDFNGLNKFNNIEINNPAGLNIGTNGLIEVNNQLYLTNGIIGTTSANRLVLLSTSTTSVSPAGGSSTSFVSGPLTKYIDNGDAFIFPLGKGTFKGHKFTLTSTTGTTRPWTAEYFTPNSTATSIAAPLEVSNTLEYWSVSCTAASTAKIKIGWDPQSDLTPLMTANGIADMRVAEYISSLWTELPSTTSGNNNTGEVATLNNVNISGTAENFTTASISGTLARASFVSTAPVCGYGGIPVSFISFTPISLNYTISYSINGSSQPDITVTSLPFILPANVPGNYRLTGFKYNNGTGTGVVDGRIVTVYTVPAPANAGSDQSLCGLSSTTLGGNNPAPYSGIWSVISGAGGSFVNNVQNNTVFNGSLGVSYTLRWTISNGPCTTSDDVVISFPVVASQPGDFTTASTQVCRGVSGFVYTVPLVSGVTYNWLYSGSGHTIHGTGNSVTIDFNNFATSGILSVTATNACGTSPARSVAITVRVASFAYTGSPYCQNQSDPLPVLDAGGLAGTFSSSPGLVFLDSSTGQIDLSSSLSGTYTVTNTVPVAGCGTLTATNTITISGLVWIGTLSTDWNIQGNWSCGFVPYSTTQVQIPDVANKPVINSGVTAEVRNITVENGSSLTVASGTLRIFGSVTSNSGVDASGGTVEFAGSSGQSVGNNVFTGNTVGNLTVNNNSGVALLGSLNVRGVVLVQNGNLASDGHLTLLSDTTQTALIDGSGTGTVTGDVTMQRYLPSGFGYKYFSSPFQAATVSQFGDDMDLGYAFPLFYRFNENSGYSGWINWTNSANPLNPFEGYAVNFGELAAPKTADITGMVNNGNLSITLFNHDSLYTEGFNLVGNPYPSPVDWDGAGWTKSNIDDALYYFKASDTDQYGGTYHVYVNGIPSDGLATNIIPSMQGFFVHVSDATIPATGILGVNNSARINNLTHPFLKSAKATDRFLIRATADFTDDTASADPLVIYFDDAAQETFDGSLDALKLMNTDMLVTNFYSVLTGGKKLSVNALPGQLPDTVMKVALGLTTYRDGEVRFRIRDLENLPVGLDIYFRDAVTGSNISMIADNDYSVILSAGDYNGRFSLAFLKSSTGIDNPGSSGDVFGAYVSTGIVRATVNALSGTEGAITIYDMTGRPLFIKKIYETGRYDLEMNLKGGMYLVRYTSGKLRRTVKLIIGL